MEKSEYKSQFGWPDDGGIGERLIQQILRKEKTATASPKALYTEKQLAEIYESKGKAVTVIDKDGNPRCTIQMLEVFETLFGAPDPRLVAGEGYGSAQAFQESHRRAWGDLVQNGSLVIDEKMILIAELFQLVDEDDL